MSSADVIAPTVYWTMLESALAIISACLPTLRPAFHGWSPESMVQSVRSKMSLQSLRSDSKETQDVKQSSDKRYPSFSESSGSPFRSDITASAHKTTISTNDIQMHDALNLPSMGIVVQQGWSRCDNLV